MLEFGEVSPIEIVIAIDAGEAHFAVHRPGSGIDITSIRSYACASFPTATDCVQNFAREAGIELTGLRCAVAVSGAINGDSIRLARCPWILSMQGFGYLFRRHVAFLNDSAAMLWAATDHAQANYHALHGAKQPDFTSGGKWVGINYDSGLGVAMLVSDGQGNLRHVETEAGHMAFAPASPAEHELSAALGILGKAVSWERALFAEAGALPMGVRAAAGSIGDPTALRAGILGSFVGDVILATGAWDGVLLFGQSVSLLSNMANADMFQRRKEARANFQYQLRGVPCWTVSVPNLLLSGAARFLDHGAAELRNTGQLARRQPVTHKAA